LMPDETGVKGMALRISSASYPRQPSRSNTQRRDISEVTKTLADPRRLLDRGKHVRSRLWWWGRAHSDRSARQACCRSGGNFRAGGDLGSGRYQARSGDHCTRSGFDRCSRRGDHGSGCADRGPRCSDGCTRGCCSDQALCRRRRNPGDRASDCGPGELHPVPSSWWCGCRGQRWHWHTGQPPELHRRAVPGLPQARLVTRIALGKPG